MKENRRGAHSGYEIHPHVGLYDEVPKAGANGRGAVACAGFGAGDLRGTRCEDHEGACIEVTDEIVAEYIANQTDNRDDDFKVEG